MAAANTIPIITSNGGGDTADITVLENGDPASAAVWPFWPIAPSWATTVTKIAATDPDVAPVHLLVNPFTGEVLSTWDGPTYSVIGGPDADDFAIDRFTGTLYFRYGPDFEAPTDADGDNVYVVQVQVDDGLGGTDTHGLTITVEAVDEAPTGILLIDQRRVEENCAPGTLVGELAASDPEGGAVTFSTAATSPFEAVQNMTTGAWELRVRAAGAVIDYEGWPGDTGSGGTDVIIGRAGAAGGSPARQLLPHAIPVTVTVSDAAGHSSSRAFDIGLIDVSLKKPPAPTAPIHSSAAPAPIASTGEREMTSSMAAPAPTRSSVARATISSTSTTWPTRSSRRSAKATTR